MNKPVFVLLATATAFACFAAGTRTWQHGTQADFERGKLAKLSLRSDGQLSLAPVFGEVYDPSVTYLWGVAEDSKGRVYVGGTGADSGEARLFEIDASAKGRVLASFPELSINAIAVDSRDRVYVATSPDGKVYRVTGENKYEVYYDPKAKYIWALAFNSQGDLFVATGDKGEIHRVNSAGSGSIFFKTEETHARSMAIDAKGNVYVGTEPGGLVLRITPGGEGFVLYQASKREVTALATHPSGAVYAAAVGNKQPGGALTPAPAAAPPAAPSPSPATVPAPNAPAPQAQTAAPRPAPTAPAVPSQATVSGGSEVIRIEPDGYPRELWTHASDVVYAIAFDAQGRALLGTGNKGNIYRLDSDLLSTLLVDAAPAQVTGLISGRKDRVLAITGNIGKVFQLGPDLEKEGSYESDVLDASNFTYWGRMHFDGTPSPGGVTLETRSGNLDPPQKNWSPWAVVPLNSNHGRVASPPARFLQYKITLKSAPGAAAPPAVSSIDVAYQPKNVAPVVELIGITPANYRFPAQSLSLTPTQNLSLPPLGRTTRSPSSRNTNETPSNSMTYARGHLGARWLARDENGDSLVSKAEIRGVNETVWKLLKDEIKERNLSWDSTAFPDGAYRLRVTVSDSPSNPPHEALTAALESEPFVIDNTPPAVESLTAMRSGARVDIRWRAVDAQNILTKAEYSLDGGDWLFVEPTTRLSDSHQHDYTLTLQNIPPGEHTIAVRVTDEYDNQTVAKAIVR